MKRWMMAAVAWFACGMVVGCGSDIDARSAMVEELLAARRTMRPIAPLTQTHKHLSIDEGYRVQEALVRRLADRAGRPVGYKVAFTSKAAQQAWQIAEPAYGRLLASMQAADAAQIDPREFMSYVIELEVAFVIGRRIDRQLTDPGELRAYVKSVHAAFDLSTIRFDRDTGPIRAADVVADAVGANRFILGRPKDPAEIDVGAVTATLRRNDRVVYQGPAAAAMGSPWNVLLWLSNKLIAGGGGLQAGDVVLTGALDKPLAGGRDKVAGRLVGDCGPLGRVSCVIPAAER